MDRVAIFIDAGYLFAQGSTLLTGSKKRRGEIDLNHERVLEALTAFATTLSGLPLLRIYWYDGTSTGPSSQHLAMAHQPGVKVRLGFVNSVGQQKGVDSLIITDMIALARNGAMSDAVLLSGDEDLRVGVQQAQEFGVRVHLLGIKPSRGSQSLTLLQEADSCHEWALPDVARFLTCSTSTPEEDQFPEVPHQTGGRAPSSLDELARRAAEDIPSEQLAPLLESIEGTGQVPREIDGKLLARGRVVLKRDLDSTEKKAARLLFIEACRKLIREAETPTPPAPHTSAAGILRTRP